MKRSAALLFAILMALTLLSGCAERKTAPAQADNEVITYTRIDPEKTLLYVSRSGNIFIDRFSASFMEKNPDVQVVNLDITGGNPTVKPFVDWVTNGQAPDIMFVAGSGPSPALNATYFEDLSANPVINSYAAEALNRVATDGRIYWLPGPSQIDCIIYNMTLFDQYGWEPPQSFDAFVALCKQIREDTNGTVQPWNPNAKYSDEFLKVVEGVCYEEVFNGLENRAWYASFCAGEKNLGEHLRPLYNMLQTLIDDGILIEDHFSYSATTRGKEFAAGEIAMINSAISNNFEGDHEFGFIPFPSTTGEDGYVCSAIQYVVGVPKKEHTDAERDAIDRYIAYFSSAEGQNAFIGDQLMISNVNGVTLSDSDRLAGLVDVIEQGRQFSLMKFDSDLGSPAFSFSTDALSLIRGERTADDCIAALDQSPYSTEEAPVQTPVVLATVKENFTILEASNLIADMYRETTGADIGLINNNAAYRGNLNKLFAGPLTAAHINAFKPRSFDNDSTLVKLSMSGQQLLDALDQPIGNNCIKNSFYAFSGLKCKVAPWKPLGEKYLSVSLENGKPIDPEALYTVAVWAGTIADEYITNVLDTYEGTWEDVMSAYLLQKGSIAPARDGRITLVWD